MCTQQRRLPISALVLPLLSGAFVSAQQKSIYATKVIAYDTNKNDGGQKKVEERLSNSSTSNITLCGQDRNKHRTFNSMVESNEYAEFLSQVEPKWHADFANFIKAGDASEEFTEFLNADKACQDAVDVVINAEGAAFERLASILSGGETDSGGAASARIALAIEDLLELPGEERSAALKKAAEVLKETVADRRPELTSAVLQLGNQVAQ